MPGKAAKVTITERQQECLRLLSQSPFCPDGLSQRAQMILLAFDKWGNAEIADHLGCERHSVGVWRRRWAHAFERLIRVECMESDGMFHSAVAEVLSDRPRVGGNGVCTAEQIEQILNAARQAPVQPVLAPATATA